MVSNWFSTPIPRRVIAALLAMRPFAASRSIRPGGWFVNDRLAQAALQFSILWNLKKLGNDQWPLPNETPQMISQRVKSILWDYATNYAAYKKFPPRTPNPGVATYTTLDESVWAIALAWSFDLIRAALSPSEQRSIVVAFPAPHRRTSRRTSLSGDS